MPYDDFDRWGWQPYVPVAERRRQALREIEKRKRKGETVSPIEIKGRQIATTFWGKAWCDNLEAYSDYANRLPRGRTYVRNGLVVDLQVGPGVIQALVSGSELYDVKLTVTPVTKLRWKSICNDCAGGIDSLVDLLQGRLSRNVMARICHQQNGLFPKPAEIKLSCSCPDGAYMCKHLAAVLYGIGARLDQQPELLFKLRGVNAKELIAKAGESIPLAEAKPGKAKVLESEDLAGIFGLDMAGSDAEKRMRPVRGREASVPAKKKKKTTRQSRSRPAARHASKQTKKS